MRKILISLTSMLFAGSLAFAQQATFPKKIKVVLLGTFHFDQTTDKSKTTFSDLFTPKRQKELDELCERLAKVKPTSVFVETAIKNQSYLDSLYALYIQDKLTDTVILRNEIRQIGFRLSKLSKLPTPKAVDHVQPLPFEEMSKFENGVGKTLTNPPFFDMTYPFNDASKKISLKNMSLSNYYVSLNDLYHRQQNEFDYLHYALSYGYKHDYTGVSFATSWYDRNLKIFTNILRTLEPKDQCIVVVFGSSHTAILRQFFENHPSFEILELQHILQD